MGRHVNKGEKAIRIIAPSRMREREGNDKTDDEGQERTETEKKTERTWGFRATYVVCQHFGIDTGDYSFAYLTGWSSGKELPELKKSLDVICRTADWLIDRLEEAMAIGEDDGIGMLTM